MAGEILRFDVVDSTNAVCKRLAAEGAPDGTVVIADRQSAGRGRLGRSFQSPAGLGLYFSVLWRPVCSPEALLPLTAMGAVAAARAVERVSHAFVDIKWPNDLLLGSRKLAGILTESALNADGSVAYVVLGIGVNVHQQPEDFAGEVRELATSLDAALEVRHSRRALAEALREELTDLPAPEAWLAEYRRRCVTLGREVRLQQNGAEETVTAVDIDPRYGLIVRRRDGSTVTVRSGEASLHGTYRNHSGAVPQES